MGSYCWSARSAPSPLSLYNFSLTQGLGKILQGEEGLSYLTARGLLLGTSKRKVTTIHEELDFMGAGLSSSSGRDYATLSLKVLKKDLDKGMGSLHGGPHAAHLSRGRDPKRS